MQKKKDKAKKGGKEGDIVKEGKRGDMKSSKFFKKMQDIAKDDSHKKEMKKRVKRDFDTPLHNHASAKKFKI
jgi:hypothetical protein